MRRLSDQTLRAIEGDANDYSRSLRQPRRIVRRLLNHIAYLTQQIATLDPGKDQS